MSCLTHAAQLERHRGNIEKLGGCVMAIGPGSEQSAARLKKLFKLRYPVFGDRRATVYGLFGLRRVLAIVQQSGAAVIDREGVITYLHRTANPQDALRIKEIIGTLERGGS